MNAGCFFGVLFSFHESSFSQLFCFRSDLFNSHLVLLTQGCYILGPIDVAMPAPAVKSQSHIVHAGAGASPKSHGYSHRDRRQHDDENSTKRPSRDKGSWLLVPVPLPSHHNLQLKDPRLAPRHRRSSSSSSSSKNRAVVKPKETTTTDLSLSTIKESHSYHEGHDGHTTTTTRSTKRRYKTEYEHRDRSTGYNRSHEEKQWKTKRDGRVVDQGQSWRRSESRRASVIEAKKSVRWA